MSKRKKTKIKVRVRTKADWKKLAGIVGAASAVVAILMIAFPSWRTLLIKPLSTEVIEPITPTSPDLNHPQLDASLVVDEISDGSLSYHFTLENSGKLPAQDIRILFSSPILSGENITGYPMPSLDPGTQIIITNNLFTSATPAGAVPLDIAIHCAYWAQIAGHARHYHSRFQFQLHPETLCKAAYTPINATFTEGLIAEQDELKSLGFQKVLQGPTGFTAFWFDVTPRLRHPIPSYFWNTPGRSLLFDPRNSNVVFSTTLGDKRVVKQTRPLRFPEKHLHFVAVQWTTTNAMLTVDGPEPPPITP